MAPRLEYLTSDLVVVLDADDVLARFARQGWVGATGDWPHSVLEEHLFWIKAPSGTPFGPYKWARSVHQFLLTADNTPLPSPSAPNRNGAA